MLSPRDAVALGPGNTASRQSNTEHCSSQDVSAIYRLIIRAS